LFFFTSEKRFQHRVSYPPGAVAPLLKLYCITKTTLKQNLIACDFWHAIKFRFALVLSHINKRRFDTFIAVEFI